MHPSTCFQQEEASEARSFPGVSSGRYWIQREWSWRNHLKTEHNGTHIRFPIEFHCVPIFAGDVPACCCLHTTSLPVVMIFDFPEKSINQQGCPFFQRPLWGCPAICYLHLSPSISQFIGNVTHYWWLLFLNSKSHASGIITIDCHQTGRLGHALFDMDI